MTNSEVMESAKESKESKEAKVDLSKPHISREQIQTILGGIKPRNLDNYRRALVHRSMFKLIKHTLEQNLPVCSYLVYHDQPASNERLEFLGDSVFNLIVGEYIFEKYPNKDEGFLTRLRTKIVRDTHCVKFSKLIGIGPFILASLTTGNDKLLEDAFEAFLGAVYLDLGYVFSKAFICRLLDEHVDLNSLLHDDNYKDILMRYTQNKGVQLPEYTVISQDGPPHKRVFTVQVSLSVDGRALKLGFGKGSNKRNAEQEAAMNTLSMINDDDLKDIAGRDL